jgi:uncharacterized protein (DUF952 family)
MSIILHIAHRSAWASAVPSGYYKPLSLASDGFIHCSTTEQTAETANQFYAGQEDLVLLCINTKKTEAEVKYEAPICANDQRTADLFPHIYGPLNVSAVIQVVDFTPGADGKFKLPEILHVKV